MNKILDLIDEPDFCALPVFILVLVVVGKQMAGENRVPLQWSARLSAAALIAYAIHAGLVFGPSTAEDWIGVMIRGLLATGLTFGICLILLAIAAFIYRHVFASPLAKVRELLHAKKASEEQRQQAQEDQRRRENEEVDRKAREQQQAKTQAEAQRRRTNARASAALTFSLYAPKLGARFTREMCDNYVNSFMGDEHSPQDVERRREELVAILDKHVGELPPPKKATTVEELASWFQDQQQRIESLPIDEKAKRAHLVELKQRYSELNCDFLQRMKP